MGGKYLTIGIIALIFVGLGIFLYGCTTQSVPTPIPEPGNQQQVTLANNVVEANNLLSIDLYNKYKSKDGNLFFSPYSILSALSMTYEGASGKTAKEMQRVLHLPDDKEKIHSDFMTIYSEINKENKSYQLTTANALWAQKDYPFKENYSKLVSDYYNGKVTNLDFKTDAENSRAIINNWVENKTNGKIKDIISEGTISPKTRLVLTSAIYFKSNWSIPFNVEDTRDEDFKLSSGKSVVTKMMHQTDYFNYGETKDLQILEMDYLGNDLSMLIILPKENNLSSIENSISTTNLTNWKKNMGIERVRVTLPKFKFETEYPMSEDLKEMGMPTAFNSVLADFTGMWTRQDDENLYISKVIHKAFIEVAECRTEAAASTTVGIPASISSPYFEPAEQPKIFKADHPFIFIIQQKDTGNILFMGRLSDPTK